MICGILKGYILNLRMSLMHYKVPEEILEKTTKCAHDHSCVKSGQLRDKPLCKMDGSYGENLLSFTPDLNKQCPYRVHFGYGYICACPTHGAIEHEKLR